MKYLTMMIVVAALATQARAQTSIDTSKSTGIFVTTTATIQASRAMATITADGEVKIDWDAVNDCAADKYKCDWQFSQWAKLLLAVRDRTWKPMP